MSIDVDRMADVIISGTALQIAKATEPLVAQIALLTARLAEVEARAMVPGPPGDPGAQGQAGERGADGKDALDGKDGKDGVDGLAGQDGKDGERGADGADGKDAVDGKDGRDGADGKDAVDGANGDPGERGADGKDAVDGKDGRDGVDGQDGKDGADGADGPVGKMPLVEAWTDRVHYAGACVTRDGALWQAIADTGRPPGGDDWQCLAAAGADGRTPVMRGTYDPADQYYYLDIVARDGGSSVALRDSPGECPGPDWQMLTAPGKRGQKGEPGERGVQGLQGKAAAAPVGLTVDGDGLLTLAMDTGKHFSADFYPVLRSIK